MALYSDDKQLMMSIRNGDIDSFDTLFRRYYPKLLAYATQFVDGPEAENVVQDIMLSLWERREVRLSLIEEAFDTDPYTLRELGINLQKAICDLPAIQGTLPQREGHGVLDFADHEDAVEAAYAVEFAEGAEDKLLIMRHAAGIYLQHIVIVS